MNVYLVDKTKTSTLEESSVSEVEIVVPDSTTIAEFREIVDLDTSTFFVVNGKVYEMNQALAEGDQIVARTIVCGG